MLFFPIGQTTVTDTTFHKMIMNFRKFPRPWIQGDKITIILRAPPLLLMAFHIFRYLMQGFIYFCNSPLDWFYYMWYCVLHVVNNLKEQMNEFSKSEEKQLLIGQSFPLNQVGGISSNPLRDGLFIRTSTWFIKWCKQVSWQLVDHVDLF